MQHCTNISVDRDKGAYWERCFCTLAAHNGFVFTPMQIGRTESASAFSYSGGGWNHWTLPDVTVWTAPGQHHEIKHKAPTFDECFGLEKYRFDALLNFAAITEQSVLYTIHNHALNGGTENKTNDIHHWFTVDIVSLNKTWLRIKNGKSWVNGIPREVPICYWNQSLWMPLIDFWEVTL